jgi:hypothetical protein
MPIVDFNNFEDRDVKGYQEIDRSYATRLRQDDILHVQVSELC